MNIPYLIEPYNAYVKNPRKKTLIELLEEEELYFRMINEYKDTTTANNNSVNNSATSAGPAGAGGQPPFDYFPVVNLIEWENSNVDLIPELNMYLSNVNNESITDIQHLGTSHAFFNVLSCPFVKTISVPNLVVLTRSISFDDNTSLETVSLPQLRSMEDDSQLGITNATNLINVNISQMTYWGGVQIVNNTSLETIVLSDNSIYECSDNTSLDFEANKLNESTVDKLLVAFSSGSSISSSLFISGGDNSSPSSAGLFAKGVLESRGWEVTVN